MKHIYFAQTDTGVMKIGCCNNVFERMKTLKAQTRNKMSLCKYRRFPDSVAKFVEDAFIEKFRKYRIWPTKREWFLPSKEIMDYMAFEFPNVDHVCTGEGEYGCCKHKRECCECMTSACILEGHWIMYG